MVLPPECGELLAALVALFGLGIGHPELLQVRVFVVGQGVVLQCDLVADYRQDGRRSASVVRIDVFDYGKSRRWVY